MDVAKCLKRPLISHKAHSKPTEIKRWRNREGSLIIKYSEPVEGYEEDLLKTEFPEYEVSLLEQNDFETLYDIRSREIEKIIKAKSLLVPEIEKEKATNVSNTLIIEDE